MENANIKENLDKFYIDLYKSIQGGRECEYFGEEGICNALELWLRYSNDYIKPDRDLVNLYQQHLSKEWVNAGFSEAYPFNGSAEDYNYEFWGGIWKNEKRLNWIRCRASQGEEKYKCQI